MPGFLKLAFCGHLYVCICVCLCVCVCVCMCVCLFVPAPEAINNYWRDIDPILIGYTTWIALCSCCSWYHYIYISRCCLSIDTCCENQLHQCKLALCKLSIHFNCSLKQVYISSKKEHCNCKGECGMTLSKHLKEKVA